MIDVTTPRMNKLLNFLSVLCGTAALTITVVGLTACGTNTNYVDLMRVTGETEQRITSDEATYRADGNLSDRVRAWSDIKRLREKQMIMAQRIRVESMPEVQAKTMTVEQGNAKKAELVAAATARYQQAEALPRPTQGITAM